MAYEAIAKMNSEGLVSAKAKEDYSNEDLFKSYRKSLAKGVLKVMSKMGISTLQSYKGAQVRFNTHFLLYTISHLFLSSVFCDGVYCVAVLYCNTACCLRYSRPVFHVSTVVPITV